MSEYPGADGIPSCGTPIEQRPIIWVHRWGAIAWDLKRGAAGASLEQPSKAAAEKAAIADCQSPSGGGGPDCKVEFTYHDQCVAMVAGDTGHNESSALTIKQAVQIGMKTCTDAGDTHCSAVYTSCSMPVRIQ
jgi:hypothetical protein